MLVRFLTQHIGQIFCLVLLSVASSCWPSEEKILNPERTAHPVKSEGKTFYVELADTPILSKMGLMHRKRLRTDHGMIFFFSPPQRVAFWMKNTLIPLSIALLDESGVILEIRDMQPLDERLVISNSDRVSFAIEMEQGWFEKNRIFVGAIIDLSHLPRSALATQSKALSP